MKCSSLLLKSAAFCGLLALATACQQECNCPEPSTIQTQLTREPDDARPVRERLVSLMKTQTQQLPSIQRFVYTPAMLEEGKRPETLDLLSDEAIESRNEAYANVQASELVTSIFNALVGAESSANVLDVEISFSEEAIEDGHFVFAINAPKEQQLNLTMYDEEGFSMVASNELVINEGRNYRAMNIGSLAPGTYIVKLRNEADAKEKVSRINIADTE